MLTAIFTFLSVPKNLLIVALVISLVGGLAWYGARREAQGIQKGQALQLDIDQKQFQSVLSDYQKQLKDDQALLAAYSTQLTSLNTQLAVEVSARRDAQSKVIQLPDTQVQADLEAKLGGALSEIAILRKNDAIVTDYPNVLAQLDTLDKKVDNLSAQLKVTTDQRDAAISYGNTVTAEYVKAYNASVVHHSLFIKIITFGLVHDKHLNLPSPTSLKELHDK